MSGPSSVNIISVYSIAFLIGSDHPFALAASPMAASIYGRVAEARDCSLILYCSVLYSIVSIHFYAQPMNVPRPRG